MNSSGFVVTQYYIEKWSIIKIFLGLSNFFLTEVCSTIDYFYIMFIVCFVKAKPRHNMHIPAPKMKLPGTMKWIKLKWMTTVVKDVHSWSSCLNVYPMP